ncbi:MAG: hypothetical protein H6Q09_1797 [Acidobacteria bacterium]|nr:hypothetical protein [Acidobacteriota bacterium]
MAVRNTNTERQPHHSCSSPPMIGATAGATAKSNITDDMARCAPGPACTSRITALPIVMPPLAVSPCITLKASSAAKLGARAQPIDATTYPSSETVATRRRPKLSESGPQSRVVAAKASR